MKAILYSVCVGTLALALAAGGAQTATEKDKRAQRAKPQHGPANVHAASPATAARPTSPMSATARAQRNVLAAQNQQQRSYTQPRTSSAVNRKPVAATPSSQRIGGGGAAATRNSSVNPNRNAAANRERNITVNQTRNADVNRERNVAVKTQAARLASAPPDTANVNRFHNANEFRNRNNVTINRNQKFAVNRTQNAAFYRGRNVTITNNWHGDAFRGQRYAAFRNYNRQWHDRGWWRSHYTRIIFVNSGWWYWNAGYWFPAWGYAPSVSFVYDGPIYAYNGLSPDQVTVNVQEQLAAAGYYDGPIDGVLGPMTREAIAAYQADNGLAVTSAIDEPTLATMGLV